ncbi:MAG: hypothetical protein JXR97_02725 [Planctomycetes bacterium]|nr:hypothetical protein [Planctomycetota bacterium]
MSNKVCPKCHKEIDTRAPLCPCSDDALPPYSLRRKVVYVLAFAAAIGIVAIMLSAYGII